MRATQRDRVLRALRATGERGIAAPDFLLPGVIDEGKPIVRLPSRIHELREDGFVIHSRGTRNQCAVYVLVSEPEISASSIASNVANPFGAVRPPAQPRPRPGLRAVA